MQVWRSISSSRTYNTLKLHDMNIKTDAINYQPCHKLAWMSYSLSKWRFSLTSNDHTCPPPNYVRLLSLEHVYTMLFVVNYVGHIVYEEINTKNIAYYIMSTLFPNPQYITSEVYIVGCNISIRWRIMCIWETSDKVRSNSYPSYLEGFNFEIRLLRSFPKTKFIHAKNNNFLQIFHVNCYVLKT